MDTRPEGRHSLWLSLALALSIRLSMGDGGRNFHDECAPRKAYGEIMKRGMPFTSALIVFDEPIRSPTGSKEAPPQHAAGNSAKEEYT